METQCLTVHWTMSEPECVKKCAPKKKKKDACLATCRKGQKGYVANCGPRAVRCGHARCGDVGDVVSWLCR